MYCLVVVWCARTWVCGSRGARAICVSRVVDSMLCISCLSSTNLLSNTAVIGCRVGAMVESHLKSMRHWGRNVCIVGALFWFLNLVPLHIHTRGALGRL